MVIGRERKKKKTIPLPSERQHSDSGRNALTHLLKYEYRFVNRKCCDTSVEHVKKPGHLEEEGMGSMLGCCHIDHVLSLQSCLIPFHIR